MATCNVYGTFLDSQGNALSGSTLRFCLDNVALDAVGNALAPKEVTTTTASDGTWSFVLPQNISGILTLDLNRSPASAINKVKFSLVVPSTASATFASCWADGANFGGQSVSSPLTFASISGQLGVAQLPILADGMIWVGVAGTATAVSISGDASLSNAGALTLSTVNASPGAYGSASSSPSVTVNAKGLVTASSSNPIQITESQVTSLTSDLAGKQPTGNYVTALTGDITATGPGSVASTLATVNSNVGSFGSASTSPSVTVNAKGLVTAASSSSIQIAESQVTSLVSDLAGKQATGNYVTALTGDGTASGPGSVALTLATVNTNVGSFGSSTAIPALTVNAKGLVTAASTNAVVAPAGTLSGSTLAAGVTASSLTSVGTITSGTWTGTTVAIANGGTGQTAKTAAFDALQPMTTGGDIIYGGASGTGTRLANGTSGQVLTSNGTTLAPSWQTASSTSSTAGYYSGYYPSSSSNYWSTSSGTYADFTVTGTIPAPTQRSNLNFGSVTLPASSLPGFTFTAPHTGVIHIHVYAIATPQSSNVVAKSNWKLVEAGGTVIANRGFFMNLNMQSTEWPMEFDGFFSATASTSYTFKLQANTTNSTLFIGSQDGIDSCLDINMFYIT